MEPKQLVSPSVLMTLPSLTYTQTPHSILPQPRQALLILVTSPALAASSGEPSARAVPVIALDNAVAVPAITAVFMNVRRDMLSLLPMCPLLSFACRYAKPPWRVVATRPFRKGAGIS